MLTTKAKSAVYHIEATTKEATKAKIHLLQAQEALPKGDANGRAIVSGIMSDYDQFLTTAANAVKEITEANQTEPE